MRRDELADSICVRRARLDMMRHTRRGREPTFQAGVYVRTVRWSVAAAAIFGGLLLLAFGFLGLLLMSGLMNFEGASVGLYLMLALPAVLLCGGWLLLVVWCYVDAERRQMNAPLWAILVFILCFPVGPLVYLILRRPLAEAQAPGQT